MLGIGVQIDFAEECASQEAQDAIAEQLRINIKGTGTSFETMGYKSEVVEDRGEEVLRITSPKGSKIIDFIHRDEDANEIKRLLILQASRHKFAISSEGREAMAKDLKAGKAMVRVFR